ncbi:MAG: stage II sporulation protein P [Oscillospiraceae bacterium]|nr:stage II sporulation protein P [Oscillospiraceae bacterium]
MRDSAKTPTKSKAKPVFTLLISVTVIVAACVFGGSLSSYFERFAVVAAGLGLPEGGRAAVQELLGSTGSSSPGSPENTAKTTQSTTQGKDGSKNDAESQAPYIANKDYLTKTPDDVAAVMAAALKELKGQETGGITSAKTFALSDGTESFEKISVKNTTEQTINIETLMTKGIDVTIKKDAPTVLIYHTHTTESYCLTNSGTFPKGYSGRSRDESKNMVRVGNEIASELEQAGISVIHDTEIHDSSYNDSYDRSREAVERYLKEYPSIQITLDVHRDAIHYDSKTYCRPVAEVLGKNTAQVMILTGAEGGRVSDFPNWEQNLDFALTLQNYGENMYAGLMRPIMFCQRKYNLDLGKYSLLLEMGTDGNTLEEAVYAGRLIGNVLATVLLDAA